MSTKVDSTHEKPALSEALEHDLESGQDAPTAHTEQAKTKATNIVDWDGPDDPQNPRNWPAWRRISQVIFASAFLLTA